MLCSPSACPWVNGQCWTYLAQVSSMIPGPAPSPSGPGMHHASLTCNFGPVTAVHSWQYQGQSKLSTLLSLITDLFFFWFVCFSVCLELLYSNQSCQSFLLYLSFKCVINLHVNYRPVNWYSPCLFEVQLFCVKLGISDHRILMSKADIDWTFIWRCRDYTGLKLE